MNKPNVQSIFAVKSPRVAPDDEVSILFFFPVFLNLEDLSLSEAIFL